MKKFIVNILIFSIAFFVIEKLFYIFLVISPTKEIDKRLEKIINGEINKELIIFGSSRGARNIIASQIEDSLQVTSYNLSYPGSNIDFHEFLLRSLIKFNNLPKTVILAIDDSNELIPDNSIKFRFDRLYPLSKYDYINNEMIKRDEKNILSKIFILSRINKSNFDLRNKSFSKLDTLFKDGSMPISFPNEDRSFTYNNNNTTYDSSNEIQGKVDSFLKFQELCISNDIKLYLVFSPNYKNRNLIFEERILSLARPEVSYYTYDKLNMMYKDKKFFFDSAHLQKNGAEVFTGELIEKLKFDGIR